MDYAEMQKRFGLALKGWRRRCSLSQEELAWRAGLHRSYVADIERGARNASLQSIEKLARALEISFSTFFEPFGDFPGSGAIEKRKRPVEILLVSDDAAEIEAVVQAFRQAHVKNHIHVARTGAAALEYLAGTSLATPLPGQKRPQLILLDLNAPTVGALDMLRRLKQCERERSISVIVLAASPDDPEVVESKRLGAEVSLTKPVDIQRFSDLLPKLSYGWQLFQHE